MNKTVREFALEHRIAELERELHLARARAGPEYHDPQAVTEPVEISLPAPHPIELRMAAACDCDIDEDGNWLVRVKGWAKGRQKFTYSYYVSVNQLQQSDLLNLLGHLHERTIRTLAHEYGKQFKPA